MDEDHNMTFEERAEACSYKNALNRAMHVRLDRKMIYGDSWKNSSAKDHLDMVKMKARRVEDLIMTKTLPIESLNDKDRIAMDNRRRAEIKDSAIDLVNYALFLLESIE
jgi:hypothetical protein